MKSLRTLFVIISAAAALCLGCCSEDGIVPASLRRAEAVVDQHPDSALAILQGVDTAALYSPRAHALYGLLLTQALDKCYMPLPPDSLIAASAAYFAGAREHGLAARSEYYRGRVLFEQDSLRHALYCFLRAEDLAKQRRDFFWAGMAARGAADTFNRVLSSRDDSIQSAHELEYFRAAGRQPFINYAMLDYAYAVYGTDHPRQVLTLCEEILDSARASSDEHLRALALSLMASSYWCLDEFPQMLDVSRQIMDGPERTPDDSLYLAVALAETGHPGAALDLLRRIEPQQTTTYHNAAMQVYLKAGLRDQSDRSLMAMDSAVNQRMRQYMHHGFASTVADYYNVKAEQNDRRLWHSRRLYTVIALCVALAAVCCLIFAALRMRQKQMEINRKVRFARSLHHSLERAKDTNQQVAQLIRTMLNSRTMLLDELSRIVFESNFSKSSKRQIAVMVTQLVDSVSINGEKVKELETYVDKVHDNLMSNFRRDFPYLKEADYFLFLCSILGVSSVSISLLLKGSSVSSVYNRKGRLKKRISQSSSPLAQRYLLMLKQ